MSVSTTSSVLSLITAAASSSSSASSSSTSSTTSSKLVELANGEYTAASVDSDQTDANKLGLQKEKDGNYGTTAPATAVATASSAAAQSSSSVLSALSSLTLGGS